VTHKLILLVESLCVSAVDAMENFLEGVFTLWDRDEVHVVGHQAIRDDSKEEFAATLRELLEILLPVGLVAEDLQSPDASLSYVVRHSRHDDACCSWHCCL